MHIFQPICFIPAMLICAFGLYHFIQSSVTLPKLWVTRSAESKTCGIHFPYALIDQNCHDSERPGDSDREERSKLLHRQLRASQQHHDIMIPNNRKQQVHDEIKNHQTDQDPPEYMNCPLNTKEFEEALKTLKDKKSPGPDKITNEMLEHLGTKAKSKLLGIFNNSWKTGDVHCPEDRRWLPG